MIHRTLAFALASLAAPIQASAQLAPGDIRAWYGLAGELRDQSGNGFDAALPGGASDPLFVADAERWIAIQFDGVDDFLWIDALGEYFSELSPGGELAVSFWLRTLGPAGNAEAQNVIMGAEPGAGVIEIVGVGSWDGMGNGPDGGVVGINSGGGSGSTTQLPGAAPGELQDGRWHHVVLQWQDPDGTVEGNDGADAEIWIDGVRAVDANAATFNGNNNDPAAMATLGMGTGSDGAAQRNSAFSGRLSDVLFFTRQLTDDDIEDVMRVQSISFRSSFELESDDGPPLPGA